jgi:hypothetical protein
MVLTAVVSVRQIKNGMGSPLETSEAFFYTTDPSSELQVPGVASASRVSGSGHQGSCDRTMKSQTVVVTASHSFAAR